MSKSKQKRRRNNEPKQARPIIPPLASVCSAPDDLLGKLDIAAINLMCAADLPGSENLDHGKLFEWLDDAARRVDLETRRHWYRFIASPGTYNHSPGFFSCYMLLQVLQEDFRVRYNPERAIDPTWQDLKQEPVFKDSRDLFIHGIIDGPGGTCGSIPVIYVAVGRRLGYPLKLVEARGHLFIRWDDSLGLKRGTPERFNVEGSGQGIFSYPDEHYRTWPQPWNEEEKQAGCYLRSLTPKEELATFLASRAMSLEDLGRNDEAVQAYRWACGLTPNDARPRNNLQRLIFKLQKDIFEMNAMIAMQSQQRAFANPLNLLAQGHPPGCHCCHCEHSRLPPGRPGHHSQCGCLDCKRLRTPIARAPRHMSECDCFQCRDAQVKARQRIAGHPLHCGCGRCRTH